MVNLDKSDIDEGMNQALRFDFERLVKEFAEWRAVHEDERSPAAAWWWGPAMAALGETAAMPDAFCAALGLPAGACYADAAARLIESIAGQTSLPWPDLFPRKPRHTAADDGPPTAP